MLINDRNRTCWQAVGLLGLIFLFFVISCLFWPKNAKADYNIYAGHEQAHDIASSNFYDIPLAQGDTVSGLKGMYFHSSHGAQIPEGINMLDTAGVIDMDSMYILEHCGNEHHIMGDTLTTGEGLDWWFDWVDTVLTDSSGYDWFMVSWGSQRPDSADIYDHYLLLMDSLESEHSIVGIYSTPQIPDDSAAQEEAFVIQGIVQRYCEANNKILFDHTDITRYDPDGTDHAYEALEQFSPGYEVCDINSDTWFDDWCETYPDTCHVCVKYGVPDDTLYSNWDQWCWYADDENCPHGDAFNCQSKGQAFWYILARLSGWTEDSENLWYVNKAGDNDSSGHSWARAHVDFTNVLDSVEAGDTLFIGAGTWYNTQINAVAGVVYMCSTAGSGSWLDPIISSGDTVVSWTDTTISGETCQKAAFTPSGCYDQTNLRTVLQNDSMLVPQGWLDSVGNVAGRMFWNANQVYVRTFGGADPDDETMVASCKNTIILNNDNGAEFYGLKILCGKQLVLIANSDSVDFKYCSFVGSSSDPQSQGNAALVFSPADDSLSRFITFLSCDFSQTQGVRVDPSFSYDRSHWGNGITAYRHRGWTVDSCDFSEFGGYGINWKDDASRAGFSGDDTLASDCLTRFSTFDGGNGGVLIYRNSFADSVYGNTFQNHSDHVIEILHATGNYGSHYVGNNTFYNVGTFVEGLDVIEALTNSVIQYNVGHDTTGGNDDDYLRITEDHYTIDSNSWFDSNSSFEGYCSGSTRNWAAWSATCGYDDNGANVASGINTTTLELPDTTSLTMNITYGGRTWTLWGAIQTLEAEASSAKRSPFRR